LVPGRRDVFWIQFGGGDPIELLKKYGDRWKLMHLQDIRKGIPKDITGLTSPENDVTIGTGDLDIPGIFEEFEGVKLVKFRNNQLNSWFNQNLK
jgi:sugar phosphate isomerase/epimerase